MRKTQPTTKLLLTLVLLTSVLVGALVTPISALAQGPGVPMPPGAPPMPAPGGNQAGPGDRVPSANAMQGDCHIGNPDCEISGYGLTPSPGGVQIWHGRWNGAPYRAGSRIQITMLHNQGGWVYLYDWQSYMGQWPRLYGWYYLYPGVPQTITARVVPPYGVEYLTLYDPNSGAYNRTHFYVVP